MVKPIHELIAYFSDNGSLTANAGILVSVNRGEINARLGMLLKNLVNLGFSEDTTYLIVACAGELMNNCFDHNLGYWTGSPGCALAFHFEKELLTLGIADRGRGIVESLHRVLPGKTPQEIITIAFEQVVTGRAPEVRGNGLKFVRQNVEQNANNSLVAFANGAVYQKGRVRSPSIEKLPSEVNSGTLVIMQWSLK